jgi:hypothetical protein
VGSIGAGNSVRVRGLGTPVDSATVRPARSSLSAARLHLLPMARYESMNSILAGAAGEGVCGYLSIRLDINLPR